MIENGSSKKDIVEDIIIAEYFIVIYVNLYVLCSVAFTKKERKRETRNSLPWRL